MEILLVAMVVIGVVAWSTKGKRNEKSAPGYKGEVKKLMKQYAAGQLGWDKALDQIEAMAKEESIRKYFRTTYGFFSFFEDELPLESYFLVIFGDMRTHYVYGPPDARGRRPRNYEDYYIGDRNHTLVVTDKNLYIGDNPRQKKAMKPVRIPLSKITDLELSKDYVEISVKSRLKGQRVHNIWSSTGDSVFYLLHCLLQRQKEREGKSLENGKGEEKPCLQTP
ncbi:MAG: hypothetical protein Q4C22_05795 [Bacillota bacterium]|nr:hypothetical protein [Bacillota bacterium]